MWALIAAVLSVSTYIGYAPLKVEFRVRDLTGYACIELWEEGLEGPTHRGCGEVTEKSPLLYRKFELSKGEYVPLVTLEGHLVAKGSVIRVLEENPSNDVVIGR